MAADPVEIKATVKAYLLKECFPGEKEEVLNDPLGLITDGILDSISTIKLVAFLEERYGIEFKAHELDRDHLNTLEDITSLTHSKLNGNG